MGNSLVDNLWYDATGNLIKVKASGSSALQKMQYDGVRRLTKRYVTYDTAETAYADASNVIGDTVLQQEEFTYDAAGNLIQQITRHRFHDATGTADLTSPTGAQPQARVMYQAFWPDAIGRAHNAVDYGTNGAAAFSRPTTAPARSDTILVTTTDFNTRGENYRITDPKGRIDQSTFDDAGRLTQTIENYVDGVPSGDTDRTTQFAYNGDGRLTTLTAKNAVTGDQLTNRPMQIPLVIQRFSIFAVRIS